MPLRVDEAHLLLRIRAPEDEDEVLSLLSEELYRPVREVLPAPAVVASWSVGRDGEGRIGEEDALPSPVSQIPGEGLLHLEVVG